MSFTNHRQRGLRQRPVITGRIIVVASLVVVHALLTACGTTARSAGDEGSDGAAREDDVARLVSDQQGLDHPRRRAADVHDAQAVGEVVDDPDVAVGGHGHGARPHPHGHGPGADQPVVGDREDLESIVRDVQGVELAAVGGQRQGPNRPGLELHEIHGASSSRQRQHDDPGAGHGEGMVDAHLRPSPCQSRTTAE